MRIIVGKREVELIPRDVKAAKQIVADFMTKVKRKAEETNAPVFYFTVLLMMHLMSQEQINALTPETMSALLNSAHRSFEISQEQKDTSR